MHMGAEMCNLFCGNTVGREFIRMEDAPDPALLGIIRHLAPEPPFRLDLAADKPAKSLQRDGVDLLCFFEDGRFCLFEQGRNFDTGGCINDRTALPELIADGEQALLPLHLAPDNLRNEVEFLNTLDLDTGATGDRDVDILPDGSETAFYLAGGAEDHADIFRDLLDFLR